MTLDPSPFLDANAPPHGAARARMRVTIGIPWVLVLLYALALIVSCMAGLAMALFLW